MEILGYLFSVLIGVSLGLIGGGGSILTVPILVYLFHIAPEKATSYSLCIVGITALLGAYRHYKLGNLQIKTAMYFAFPSVASLLFVRKMVLPKIPTHIASIGHFTLSKDVVIMVVFALLMLAASYSMIRTSSSSTTSIKPNVIRLSMIGFLVGMVTGFLGAGGGFLIIPALVFFANLPMKQAVGTSLFIIFINSLIGFGGDLINGVDLNIQFLCIITFIALIGMFIGTQLSKKINGAKLKPLFGWFILVMGCYIIIHEVFLK